MVRDSLRSKLRRAVKKLADALIAPLPKSRSIEDEAKVALITGGALRLAFIAATALASAWSLTLFGAKWQAPQWSAPRVKAPSLTMPTVRKPVFKKAQWRLPSKNY